MAIVASPDVLPVVAPANHVAGPPQGQWTYTAYADCLMTAGVMK